MGNVCAMDSEKVWVGGKDTTEQGRESLSTWDTNRVHGGPSSETKHGVDV